MTINIDANACRVSQMAVNIAKSFKLKKSVIGLSVILQSIIQGVHSHYRINTFEHPEYYQYKSNPE